MGFSIDGAAHEFAARAGLELRRRDDEAGLLGAALAAQGRGEAPAQEPVARVPQGERGLRQLLHVHDGPLARAGRLCRAAQQGDLPLPAVPIVRRLVQGAPRRAHSRVHDLGLPRGGGGRLAR